MSGVSQHSIFVAVFFGAFLAVTAAEIYWLATKLQVPTKKALTAVLRANFGPITLGFFVTFVIFGLFLAFAAGENAGVRTSGSWFAFIATLAFPFLFMAAIRRVPIGGLRIEQITRPLQYSLISTIVFLAVVFGIPAIYLPLR